MGKITKKQEVLTLDSAFLEKYLACMRSSMLCVMIMLGMLTSNGQVPRSSIPALLSLNAYSGQHTDAFAMYRMINPGKKPAGGMDMFGERKYLISETGNYLIAGLAPEGEGAFGAGIRYSGGRGYQETDFTVAYGRKLASRLEAGAEIHFVRIGMDGYGKISAPGFGLGLRLFPAEKISVCISTRDPTGRPGEKKKLLKLPSLYSFGIGFEPSVQMLFALEVLQEEGRPLEISGLLQYLPAKSVRLRAGMNLSRQSFSFSAGWEKSMGKNLFHFDVFSSTHLRLGISPGIQIGFSFAKNE